MFWFAFFHECGHVLFEHAKREVVLEGVHAQERLTATQDPREVAANEFAADVLIPQPELKHFLLKGKLTQRAIEEFADKLNIAVGIVVGRLQHDGLLDWSRFRGLKRTFSWDDWPHA
jgi:Zn-dependent peptidase ImmA (M78 family)